MKKTIFTFLFSLFISAMTFAQITGNKYIGDGLDYQDVKSAIEALNLNGVGEGGVTFLVPADWTETFLNPTFGTITTTTGSATRPIVFKKDPATSGKNPILVAAVGTGIYDAIITIAGTDYVTFDGINLKESPANLGDNSRAEWGYAILKASGTDGSQNITIRNCAVRMDTNYVATIGIYSNNHIPGGTTQLVVTDIAGTNSNLKIYYDSISSYSSIWLQGFGDPATPYSYYDQNNEIGKDGQNTITKVAGGAGWPGYGIYGRCQNNLKVANNRIGSVMGGNGAPYGIYLWHSKNGSYELYNNYVTMQYSGGTGTTNFSAIYCTMGRDGQNNTNLIYDNTVSGCKYTNVTNGTTNFIYLDSLGTTASVYGNNITYNTTGSVSATAIGTINYMYARKAAGSVVIGPFSMFSNNVSNNQRIQGGTGGGTTNLIYNRATSTTLNFYNNTVSDNQISSNGTCYALYSYGEGIKNIYGNTVTNLTKVEGTFYGIYDFPVISNSGDHYIYNNKITNIEGIGGSAVMYGLYGPSGSAVIKYNIYNNMFSDFRTPASTSTSAITGIYVSNGGTTYNIYNNSIYLNATSSATNFGTIGFHCTTASAILDMRNNIIVNTSTAKGTGKTLALRYGAVPTSNFQSSTNNNNYYAGTPSAANNIFYDGTTYYQTLANYKAAVFPRETQSVTEMPPFMNTAPGSVNLKISTAVATQVESAGMVITIPVAITTDFEGDARYPNLGYPFNPTYPPSLPDIGADEFGGIPNDQTGPSILYTPLTNINHNNNRYLTVTITDGSGIPVSGAGMPMLYWKTQILPWVGVQGVFVSPGVYSFYFGGGANITEGDVISYYVVAQDQWSTPNLSSNPPLGASGFTPNPPAAATPPTTPNSYTILGNFSGTYHVGVGKDFTTLTLAAASLNSKWIYGPVVFYLDDNTYPSETYPITFNSNPGSSSMNTVTIKPYTGAAPVFSASVGGTGATGMIKLNGIDYLTIDGTAEGNNNTRDLTIQDTYSNGTNNFGQNGIYITSNGTDPSTNNTIKGCKISCNIPTPSNIANLSFTIYGIYFASTGGPYDNTTIDNNWIKGAYYGIYAMMPTTAPATNLQITNNRIGSDNASEYIINSGIQVQYCNYPVISNNDISGYASGCVNWSQMGIGVSASVVGAKITSNIIHDFFRNDLPGTCQGPLSGMYYNSTDVTAVTEISNNVFYNLKYYGCSSSPSQSNLCGIFIRSGGNMKITHNSINLTGEFLSGAKDASSTCLLFHWQANGGNIEIKNNIFRNGQIAYQSNPPNGKAYGIMTTLPLSYFNNINYNDYWIDGYNGQTAVYMDKDSFIQTFYPTLADWKTATGQEMNSVTIDPMFTSDVDLLPTTPAMPHAGTYMSLVPVDITGANRSNPPDIGAYEFTINPGLTTTGYSNLTNSSVTLEGWVSSTSEDMNLFFDWGLTSAYGNTETGTPSSVAAHVISTFTANLSTLSPGTTYHFRARGVGQVSGLIVYGSDMTFTTPALVKTLNLKALLEGLYAGNGLMNQAQDENGNHFGAGIADQVTVELHNTSNYSTIEYSSGLVNLATNGNISIPNLPVSISGSYYITIKHRNTIETTSGFPVSFAGNTINFDFTTAAPQAFGGNQKDVGGGKFVFWAGDVNQDGIVDSGDMNFVDNASTAITIGYYSEDVNGDGIVDSGDMNYTDNNSTAIIIAQLP